MDTLFSKCMDQSLIKKTALKQEETYEEWKISTIQTYVVLLINMQMNIYVITRMKQYELMKIF